MTTIIKIITKHLHDEGFDGLYHPDAECACLIGDLNPCGETFADCKTGYRRDLPSGEWEVSKDKP